MLAAQVSTERGQALQMVACPPSPTSSDSEDFANAFDDICLSSRFDSCPSPNSSDDDLSSLSDDRSSDSDTSMDSFDLESPTAITCAFCNVRGNTICSLCSHLCDDYSSFEVAVFRVTDSPSLCKIDTIQFGSHRIRTTSVQRQLLDSVLETQRLPLSNALVKSLLQVLGPEWTKTRLLKWFDNRRFGGKSHRPQKDPFLKKKICTTEQEKLLFEALYFLTPFPSSEELDLLRKDLCAIRHGWSHRRVVQWFTNRRKLMKPRS